ncbi:MAG: adenosine deaminase [Bifidobacterium sp.]|nr:adenosine deaminase [Bifidobacterium sp.]
MADPKLTTALATMPKTELHVHIEGTLEPELALEFAARNHVELPWHDLEELREQYRFTDLQSFLDLYYTLMGTLRTMDDFRDLMLAYLERAARNGVKHAEIFFDPQVHLDNGLDYDLVLDGLLTGLKLDEERCGITGALILCIVRDKPVESAERILDIATPRAGEILGIGLDSAEVGYPPSLFTHVFARATELGWHRVAHAGEEGPASYITQALDDLHAERIDHASHAIDDPAVMARLAAERVPVTRCPLSNLRLHVIEQPNELHIHDFLDAGVITTINSDDPAYFGGYLVDNYLALLGDNCSLYDMARLGEMSIDASFLDDERKELLKDDFEAWKLEYLG